MLTEKKRKGAVASSRESVLHTCCFRPRHLAGRTAGSLSVSTQLCSPLAVNPKAKDTSSARWEWPIVKFFAYVFRSVLILLGQKQVSSLQIYGWPRHLAHWLGVRLRRRDRGEKAHRSSSLLPSACEYKSPNKYLQVSMKLYTNIRLSGRRGHQACRWKGEVTRQLPPLLR